MGEGGHLALVSICALVSYKLTVSNGISLMTQFTTFTGSFKFVGVHLPLVSICALASIYLDLPLHEI